MHRQSSIPFNQSGIGVRAITMTAKTAPTNAAAPITAAVFLLRFFFTALQISMAQTTQTAATASAITSVSHNHESSYNILIRSPYLSLANWKLLFHIHAFVNFRFIVPFRRTCAAFLPAVSGTVGKGFGKAARLYLSATSNRINIFSPHFIESDAVHIPDPSYAHKFYTPMQSSG